MLSQDEIRGDWSNLKGTEYHLVYALWLLLRDNASQVAFYEGNDLLAKPIRPPSPPSEPDPSPPISVRTQDGETDVWIQLKSTSEPWTQSNFLEGNLLENFVCNALTSLQRGHSWDVRLVTQGIVRRKSLLAFVEQPDDHPRLLTHLQCVIDNVLDKVKASNVGMPAVDPVAIRNHAIAILRRLSETEPVAMETLKAEIEAELAYVRPSRHAVQRTANQLLGALLRDAAAGPAGGSVYDVNWLEEVAGPGLKADKPFDRDEAIGCDKAVARSLPVTWKAEHSATRVRLTPLLNQFLASKETLFVLLGKGGTGKSWAVAAWTSIDLAQKIRLLFPASTQEIPETLEALVAILISPFSAAPLRDQEFLERFRAAAFGHDTVPIVAIDDIQARPGTSERLAKITRRARELGIKLLFTCQQFPAYDICCRLRVVPYVGEASAQLPNGSMRKRGRRRGLLNALHTTMTPICRWLTINAGGQSREATPRKIGRDLFR